MWVISFVVCLFFFFKQKTAYEMRISDWSSDVCSSDLNPDVAAQFGGRWVIRVAGGIRHGFGAEPDCSTRAGVRDFDEGYVRDLRPLRQCLAGRRPHGLVEHLDVGHVWTVGRGCGHERVGDRNRLAQRTDGPHLDPAAPDEGVTAPASRCLATRLTLPALQCRGGSDAQTTPTHHPPATPTGPCRPPSSGRRLTPGSWSPRDRRKGLRS